MVDKQVGNQGAGYMHTLEQYVLFTFRNSLNS